MPLYNDDRTLSDFRGMPYFPRPIKKGKTGGDIVKASSVLDLVLKNIKDKHSKSSILEIIAQNWRACVDAKLAEKSFVHNVVGNTILIGTLNPMIKQALVFKEKKILENITKLDGCANIAKIRFI